MSVIMSSSSRTNQRGHSGLGLNCVQWRDGRNYGLSRLFPCWHRINVCKIIHKNRFQHLLRAVNRYWRIRRSVWLYRYIQLHRFWRLFTTSSDGMDCRRRICVSNCSLIIPRSVHNRFVSQYIAPFKVIRQTCRLYHAWIPWWTLAIIFISLSTWRSPPIDLPPNQSPGPSTLCPPQKVCKKWSDLLNFKHCLTSAPTEELICEIHISSMNISPTYLYEFLAGHIIARKKFIY